MEKFLTWLVIVFTGVCLMIVTVLAIVGFGVSNQSGLQPDTQATKVYEDELPFYPCDDAKCA